ncbi:MAG: ribosome recycling factor [Halothiobacillaceae bacterium]|nr:MAG: ribosome recycling factor [Halothiobacillaceae bacterium]
MIADVKSESTKRMGKSIEALRDDLARLRTGRAHPGLLDHVMVNYYGNPTPLNQVANVSVQDSRTLTITPWEKNIIAAIEKAILQANLGLNPATSGTVIRVPLPPLTEERRKEMIKLVRHEGEAARVAIRNIRRDANSEIKTLLKDKKISEDEERRAQDEIRRERERFNGVLVGVGGLFCCRTPPL